MESKAYIPRNIEGYVFDESLTGRHMVFLAGPRQAYRADSRLFEASARTFGIQNPWIINLERLLSLLP